MVVHLWGKFFMGAWRGGACPTWITGAVIFLVSIGTAFTGYLSQQNFDSQWIASEGKDGLNSVGIGAYFNVIDFGQMYIWHVILLPVVVVALVVAHVLLVRRHGVVPPYPARTARERTRPAASQRGRIRLSAAAGAEPPAPTSREWHGDVRPLRPGQGVRRRAGRDHGAHRDPRGRCSPRPTTSRRRSAAGPAPTRATSWRPRSPTRRDERDRRPTARPTTTPPDAGRRSPGGPTQRWPGVHYRIDTARRLRARSAAERSRERRGSRRALAA